MLAFHLQAVRYPELKNRTTIHEITLNITNKTPGSGDFVDNFSVHVCPE